MRRPAVVKNHLQTVAQRAIGQRTKLPGGLRAVRGVHLLDAEDDDPAAPGRHPEGVMLGLVLGSVSVEVELLLELKVLGLPPLLGAQFSKVILVPCARRLVVDRHVQQVWRERGTDQTDRVASSQCRYRLGAS